MSQQDFLRQDLSTIEFQRSNVLQRVLQDDESQVSCEGVSRCVLKRDIRENLTWTDVGIVGREMETLRGRVAEPLGTPNACQEVYVMERKGFAAPWVHHAMGRREDEIVGDESACASYGAPIAADIDLTDRSPRGAQVVNHASVVIAYDARLQVLCEYAPGGKGT